MSYGTGFQAMMAYWERLQPVNAVHAAQCTAVIAPAELASAVGRLFRKFHASAEGRTSSACSFLSREPDPNAAVCPEVAVLKTAADLDGLLTQQMNRRFDADAFPFRIGLAQAPGAVWVWICYRHLIADARSIALLTQHLLEEVNGGRTADLNLRLDFSVDGVRHFFPEECRRRHWPWLAARSLRTLWQLQRCCRPKPAQADDFRTTCLVHAQRLPLQQLRETAARHAATIGELLTASIVAWNFEHDRRSPTRWRRRDRCVSVLTDLTLRTRLPRREVFGQWIAPINVFVPFRDCSGLSDIIPTVRRSLRDVQSVSGQLAALQGLTLNSRLVRLLPRWLAHRDQEFLFPVCAAVSNVNLTRLLAPPRVPLSVQSYVRATCATQFAPAIVCLTTHDGLCSVTSTHRDSVYGQADMRRLGQHVVQQLFGT